MHPGTLPDHPNHCTGVLQQITLSVPHQMSAGAVQYAVSTKVATKSVQGEDDDVKDPEGVCKTQKKKYSYNPCMMYSEQ